MEPALAYPFTVISIFGVINAFNMLDGMDGLLATLVILTIALFHLFTATQPGFVSLAIAASLLAFLVSNLNFSPLRPKTFLGDAGSKLLGFIVACLLLAAASAQVGEIKLVQPSTALFVVAIPLRHGLHQPSANYKRPLTLFRGPLSYSSPHARSRFSSRRAWQ